MRTSYLVGASSSELELAVGTLVVAVVRDEEIVSGGVGVAAHSGYRHARSEGGFLFRAGATLALWVSRSRLPIPAVPASTGWVL